MVSLWAAELGLYGEVAALRIESLMYNQVYTILFGLKADHNLEVRNCSVKVTSCAYFTVCLSYNHF